MGFAIKVRNDGSAELWRKVKRPYRRARWEMLGFYHSEKAAEDKMREQWVNPRGVASEQEYDKNGQLVR